MHPVVVGVDLGGTNVRAGVFDATGEPLGTRSERPSRATEGVAATLDAVAEVVHDVLEGRECAAVGVAIPGHIDDRTGVVRWAPNFGTVTEGVLQCWLDIPFRDELRRRLSTPAIVLGNDANLAAMGEYRYGSGENNASCFVLLTIGTGIGGGVVMRPSSVHGRSEGPLVLLGGNQGGAELGHMVIHAGGLDCNAGSYGAIEAYCQRDAIIRRAQHGLGRGRESLLRDLCAGDLNAITPKLLADAAHRGDAFALEVWRQTGYWLGIGIANCINVFAPETIAIGGQISKVGNPLMDAAKESARDAAIPSLFRDCSIVQAKQIDDAGILGAAAVAVERLGH